MGLTSPQQENSSHGLFRIGAVGVSGLEVMESLPWSVNTTDGAVEFAGGKTFSSLVGQTIALEIVMTDTIVYTIGFSTEIH